MSDIMWAIKGRLQFGEFFYCGTWLTRSNAIEAHVSAHLHRVERTPAAVKRKWLERRRNGDRAVKVKLTEVRKP